MKAILAYPAIKEALVLPDYITGRSHGYIIG
jgi:hypothetical protein